MRSIRNKLIVATSLDEKDDYSIELPSGLKLFMRSNYGHDQKLTNPVLTKVVAVGEDVDDIAPGDILLVHHNSFVRVITHGPNGEEWLQGDMGIKQDGLSLFQLERSMAWLKLDENGDPLPLREILIVERIKEDAPETSFIDLTSCDFGTKQNEFKVVKAGPGCEGVNNGDVIVAYYKSDLAINYTWNNKLRQAFRIKYSDVLGIKEAI